MRTIYKYPIGERTELRLPQGARVVDVDIDPRRGGHPTIWIDQRIGEALPDSVRTFVTVLTGAGIPERGRYVGTAHVHDDVWHVYELVEDQRGARR